MPRTSPFSLARIVGRLAKLSPPHHRELVRGMLAELDSIGDPADRRRFAIGSMAAIARLTVSGFSRPTAPTPGRLVALGDLGYGASIGGPWMSILTGRQLLRRHATPFAVSFGSMTVLLLTNHGLQQVPKLDAEGVPPSQIVEVFLLAVPHTLALTIPMAVLLSVSWVFSRLGAEGIIESARRERHGVRRLVAPVLGAAAIVATLTLVSNTQVLPRANGRLLAVLAGTPREPTDRTMTVGELREAALTARASKGPNGAAHATAYEVEIHKKFALAASCLFLALAGAASAIRFPHGGAWVVLGASTLLFPGYYLSLVAGEALADQQVIPPLVAMWMANGVLLAVALLLAWRPSHPTPTGGAETLAIGGS